MLALDLDGTLLNSKSEISKENLEAINRLADNGIKTMILTGRTFYEIPKELRSCAGIAYYVFSNGAGIRSRKKGMIHYNPILKAAAIRLFDILKSYNCFIELYANGYPYVNKDEFTDEMLRYYNIDYSFIPVMQNTRVPLHNLETILYNKKYEIEMFDVFFKYQGQRNDCIKRLKSEFCGFEITTSMTNNLEILNRGMNKGYGLKKLCEIENINLDPIIVIGDSENDISAFETAKTKYAVSNACDKLKSISDEIICSNDENIVCYVEKELL